MRAGRLVEPVGGDCSFGGRGGNCSGRSGDERVSRMSVMNPSRPACVKCGHEIRFSDNEGGTCEARIVLEQAELGVETTVCGCFCEPPFVACAQCEANARHNEAGGYLELAEQCRAYCRRGHRE